MTASRTTLFVRLITVLLLVAGCGNEEGRGAAPIPMADSMSATGAVAWIQDYYRAINERRYRNAYAHWERGGLASGKNFEEFRKGYVGTERVEITVGTPGRVEGAAGSRYVEVPVRIAARTRAGARQNFSGSYTLRLSVVDGATPEQRSWHIYCAAVRPLN